MGNQLHWLYITLEQNTASTGWQYTNKAILRGLLRCTSSIWPTASQYQLATKRNSLPNHATLYGCWCTWYSIRVSEALIHLWIMLRQQASIPLVRYAAHWVDKRDPSARMNGRLKPGCGYITIAAPRPIVHSSASRRAVDSEWSVPCRLRRVARFNDRYLNGTRCLSAFLSAYPSPLTWVTKNETSSV